MNGVGADSVADLEPRLDGEASRPSWEGTESGICD